jgi:CPA1 family monovalent cation:H+ antiporter
MSPGTRLQNESTWTVVTFLLTSLIFIMVGLELPGVVQGLAHYSLGALLVEAAIISLTVVVVRLAWAIPTAYTFLSIGRWLRRSHEALPPFRQILFVGWAGVRGADSLVIALSLPLVTATGAPFPARDQILFITFGVIFATLVVQGSTLAPLARLLGLHSDGRDKDEEAHARLVATETALRALSDPKFKDVPYPEIVRYVQQRYRQRARRWAARESKQYQGRIHDPGHEHDVAAPSHEDGELDESRIIEYRRIRSMAIDAERRALEKLRDDSVIGDDVMRRIQRDLDLEVMLLSTRDPVAEPPSEVPSALTA